MLKTNLHFVSLSLIISTLVIYCAVMVGQLQNTPRILFFTEELLCYVQTCEERSFQIARQENISQLIAQLDNDYGMIEFVNYQLEYWYSFDNDDNLNLQIQDSSSMGLMQLGELVSYFGTPCSLTITEEAVYIQFEKFFVQLLLTYDLNKPETLNLFLSPYISIENLSIYTNPVSCDTPVTFPTSYNMGSKWQGFNTLNFYISRYYELQGW